VNQNLNILSKSLGEAIQKALPGRDSHRQMIPVFPIETPDYFSISKELRSAAVLIVLYQENSRIKTVLIERMPNPGPHSGQIAFPGGRVEDTDLDLIDTALREAFEEVGVSCSRDNYIGSLTPVQIQISGFSVLPVITWIDHSPDFIMCEDEVKNIFTVDLMDLLESQTVRTIEVRNLQIQAPCFVFSDKVVWGATAMVLRELKELILYSTGI
jgi:8-oxo-dGTP pyrophosphatase MutT (NUDIX family)